MQFSGCCSDSWAMGIKEEQKKNCSLRHSCKKIFGRPNGLQECMCGMGCYGNRQLSEGAKCWGVVSAVWLGIKEETSEVVI